MSRVSRSDPARGGLLRGAPAYQASTPWGAGTGMLATAVIVALSLLGAALLLRLLGVAGAGGPEEAALNVRAVAASQALMVTLTLLASTLFGGRVREVLALHEAPAGWRSYAGALLALAVLQLVLAAVLHAIRHDMGTDLRPFVGLVRSPQWPLAAAVVGIGAPLSEELLFRGFLLSALAQTRLGFRGAAVVSTLAWAALHAGYSALGLAEVFAIGLFFSWLLWRTGSLWVPIFCHALYNSLILLALRFVDLPAPV